MSQGYFRFWFFQSDERTITPLTPVLTSRAALIAAAQLRVGDPDSMHSRVDKRTCQTPLISDGVVLFCPWLGSALVTKPPWRSRAGSVAPARTYIDVGSGAAVAANSLGEAFFLSRGLMDNYRIQKYSLARGHMLAARFTLR